ncbi:hypothetical protein Hanom_Chr10g00919181 [Helianthus anomalus]
MKRFGLTRSNRVNSANSGQHSESTRSNLVNSASRLGELSQMVRRFDTKTW